MLKTNYLSFIKDNVVVIGGHVLAYIPNIILMPIIIKSVGVTTYGGFVLLTSTFGIALGISSFGAVFRARRFMPSAKNMIERGHLFYPQFYFNLLTILILSLLFLLLENPLNRYLFKNQVSFSIWIIPLYLLSYFLYSQGSDYFRYTSRVHYMALVGLCFSYIPIGFTVIYLYTYGPVSVNMLVISTSLSALLIAIPTFVIILRELGAKFSFYKARQLVSDIKLGFPLVLGFIIDFILAASDRYFITFYLSVTDMGYYVPGYVLGSLVIMFPKALGTVLPQLLSRAIDGSKEAEAFTMVNYSIKFFFLLAIPFIFGCLALSKPILAIFANEEVAENAFLVTPIVALGTLFYGLNLIFNNVLFVRLKTNAIFNMNLIAAIFNLLANVILIYYFRNIIVAAITTLLSYFIAFIYAYRIISRNWKVDFVVSTIVKCVVSSLIMFGVISVVLANFKNSCSLIFILCIIGVATIVYTGCLFGFRTFSSKEISFCTKLFAN